MQREKEPRFICLETIDFHIVKDVHDKDLIIVKRRVKDPKRQRRILACRESL